MPESDRAEKQEGEDDEKHGGECGEVEFHRVVQSESDQLDGAVFKQIVVPVNDSVPGEDETFTVSVRLDKSSPESAHF